MDENRAIDGLELRTDFEYETGEYLDKTSGLMPKCTVFEMLAALAIRCESQLMYNPSLGDRTSKWFFEFLDNLNLNTHSRVNNTIAKDINDYPSNDNFGDREENKYTYKVNLKKIKVGSSIPKLLKYHLMHHLHCHLQ